MFSLACNLTKKDAEFLSKEISLKKVRANNVDFTTTKITSKKVIGKTWIFQPSKLHWQKYVETTWILRSSKWHQMEKSGFFDQRKYIEKVRRNNVDFLIIEITSKKYVEMTWKFVGIWSSTYRIYDIISTSN